MSAVQGSLPREERFCRPYWLKVSKYPAYNHLISTYHFFTFSFLSHPLICVSFISAVATMAFLVATTVVVISSSSFPAGNRFSWLFWCWDRCRLSSLTLSVFVQIFLSRLLLFVACCRCSIRRRGEWGRWLLVFSVDTSGTFCFKGGSDNTLPSNDLSRLCGRLIGRFF